MSVDVRPKVTLPMRSVQGSGAKVTRWSLERNIRDWNSDSINIWLFWLLHLLTNKDKIVLRYLNTKIQDYWSQPAKIFCIELQMPQKVLKILWIVYVIQSHHCIFFAEVGQAERWLRINVVVMNISLRWHKHKSASRPETIHVSKSSKQKNYKLVKKLM